MRTGRARHVGLTLLYARRHGRHWEATQRSIVVDVARESTCEREVERVLTRAHRASTDLGPLRGLADLFRVVGRNGEGRILGRSTLSRRKTLVAAARLVKSDLEKRVDRSRRWIVAAAVYFVRATTEVDAHAVIANVLVRQRSSVAATIRAAQALARSLVVKKRVVQDYPLAEKPSDLAFVGLESIHGAPEDVSLGGAFEVLVRRFRRLAEVDREAMSEREVHQRALALDEA